MPTNKDTPTHKPIVRAPAVLKAHYRQFTKGKKYCDPQGHEIDPAVHLAWGASTKWPKHSDIPLSYKGIILNAEPGDVLDDGVIQEHFGHALHVKER